MEDWKNKSLSIAGRLQLISSVIGSMHVFWASAFIIPSRVLHDIEQLMRGFLWCQGNFKRGKAKVAWDVVCLPKREGGLGIRRLDAFNSALMVSHMWKLVTLKQSLWVKWIHMYKLKGRSFWDIPMRGAMSWSWRKLLQLRSLVRNSFWTKIGEGLSVSLWFDKWCAEGPLCLVISMRDVYAAGLNPSSKVCDIVHNGQWNWPMSLLVKYPFLDACSVPLNVNAPDVLVWRDRHENLQKFSVSQVWSSIRPREAKVLWYDLVWFSACIPRHAFHFWLVIQRKLKTQDRICSWDVAPNLASVCSLCELQSDSHEHLFFACPFSQRVWDCMRSLAEIPSLSTDVFSIIDILLPSAKKRTSWSIVAKLVLEAATYFVWQERNRRLFKNIKRTSNQVIECISASVRLKLMSCKFKRSEDSEKMARKWDLPDLIFIM